MIRINFGSHNRIKATLTDENGDAVTGATVTLTVTDRSGTVAINVTMNEDGGGVYSYLATPSELTKREHKYKAKVEATSPATMEREAEVVLFTAIDAD